MIPHSSPLIERDDINAVSEVLSSGNIAQGVKVREFEEAIACFIGVKNGAACSSGTSALHLALLALGVGQGDEVIMPSYVCSSPYFATLHVGASPKIADITLADFNLSVESAKKGVTAKTKAIIVPHMFGTPAAIDELLELDVPIIEDCAQSIGSEYRGKKAGSFGDLSTFSFYATKMITSGEGGMVLTNNHEFHNRVAEVRDYDKKPLSPTKYNYKMTDIQAALGLSQLKKLQYFIKRRAKIAVAYNKAFARHQIELPVSPSHRKSVHFRYVVKTSDRNRIQYKAKKRGVICETPVNKPLHISLGLKNFGNSDKAKQKGLSIPIYPSLSEAEIEHIIRTMEHVFSRERQ